jgi:hypothetical protein
VYHLTCFLASLLTAVGLTILVIWPANGPSAFIRDRVLRSLLPVNARVVLDCYVCCGFWCGLFLSPILWALFHEPFVWLMCLMTSALFWLMLGLPEKEREAGSS